MINKIHVLYCGLLLVVISFTINLYLNDNKVIEGYRQWQWRSIKSELNSAFLFSWENIRSYDKLNSLINDNDQDAVKKYIRDNITALYLDAKFGYSTMLKDMPNMAKENEEKMKWMDSVLIKISNDKDGK